MAAGRGVDGSPEVQPPPVTVRLNAGSSRGLAVAAATAAVDGAEIGVRATSTGAFIAGTSTLRTAEFPSIDRISASATCRELALTGTAALAGAGFIVVNSFTNADPSPVFFTEAIDGSMFTASIPVSAIAFTRRSNAGQCPIQMSISIKDARRKMRASKWDAIQNGTRHFGSTPSHRPDFFNI